MRRAGSIARNAAAAALLTLALAWVPASASATEDRGGTVNSGQVATGEQAPNGANGSNGSPPPPARAAPSAPAQIPGVTLTPGGLPEKPQDYAVSAKDALAAADADPKIRERTRELGPDERFTATVTAEAVRVWEVGYFLDGDKVNLVVVDGGTGAVTESWTGSAVDWPMARGHEGQFGHLLNAPWVWGPLAAIFLLGLIDFRRWRRWVHLDLAVLLSFGISQAFFNAAEIGVSVPLYYPPLLYLLVRMLWIGFRGAGRAGGAGAGLRPSMPIWLMTALAIGLIALRIAGNVSDSGVIDVGYAGVIGADKITDAKPIYGQNSFPENNPTGDTYGPANYFAYVPFEAILPWSGAWDDLPAAHAAAVTFDLATILGLFTLGRVIRRRRGDEGEIEDEMETIVAGSSTAFASTNASAGYQEDCPGYRRVSAGHLDDRPGDHRDGAGLREDSSPGDRRDGAGHPAASAGPNVADRRPDSAGYRNAANRLPDSERNPGDSRRMDAAWRGGSTGQPRRRRHRDPRSRRLASLRRRVAPYSPLRAENSLGTILVFAWVAYPYSTFALQSNSNDALISALLVWSLVAFAAPLARGALLATAGLAKFAPLALIPLYAAGRTGIQIRTPEARHALLRPLTLFAGAFVVASLLLIAHPAVDPGLAAFYDRTIKSQVDRTSPFSIWGQADLEWLHTAVKLGAIGLAVLAAFVPRRRSLPQIAALSAAVIIGIQLTLEHWFYLYIPWFLPMLLLAIAVSRPPAAAPRDRAEPGVSNDLAAASAGAGV